ncbi:DEAD/DEAH box helicase family protein [Scleromatobacter humisilvae]|uniref:DEAD/DEAH box helicase family protein n=1 Tax=Scleromatobacter humisilvae TaxID=2897159 RepID=A0A9X1YQP2_9BURK|nr:DEAD/DEAH box helicase family protein [Scleromatobacter humisilvae]MCK9689473.1 DEAD/DEAH box helicase family protein [Scleromatobacter humisilvae]
MLEWLTGKVVDKLADWTGGKLAGGRARMKVRGALEKGGGLEKASVDATIAAALDQLVSEPFLNSQAAQPTVKEWLQVPEVQRAFSNYVLGIQGSDSSLASGALRVLAAEYAARTGESARLAEGKVRQAADYVVAQVKREPAQLTLAGVVELLARQRSEGLPAPADERLDRLRRESLAALSALPVAVPLVDVAAPALFALAPGERRGEPVSAEAIAAVLIDGESVLIHGTGGAGKTTCLAEVAKRLARAPKRPIPLYLSASEWAFSGHELLDHVCSQPAVLRAGISKDDASKLIEERQLVLLVDGWNEVAADRRAPLVASVGQFLRGQECGCCWLAASDFSRIARSFDWEQMISANAARDKSDSVSSCCQFHRNLRTFRATPATAVIGSHSRVAHGLQGRRNLPAEFGADDHVTGTPSSVSTSVNNRHHCVCGRTKPKALRAPCELHRYRLQIVFRTMPPGDRLATCELAHFTRLA